MLWGVGEKKLFFTSAVFQHDLLQFFLSFFALFYLLSFFLFSLSYNNPIELPYSRSTLNGAIEGELESLQRVSL